MRRETVFVLNRPNIWPTLLLYVVAIGGMVAFIVLVGCGGSPGTPAITFELPPPVVVIESAPDAGAPDAGFPPPVDAGDPVDAGQPDDAGIVDAGQPMDAGPADAGTPVDAGSEVDAGPITTDAGHVDAGEAPDAGLPEAGLDAGSVDWNPWGTANGTLTLDNNQYNNAWGITFVFRSTLAQGPPDAVQLNGLFNGFWVDPRNGRVFLPAGTFCSSDLFYFAPKPDTDPGRFLSDGPAVACTGACIVTIDSFRMLMTGGIAQTSISGTYSCYGGGTWAVSAAPHY